ncbi:MAG TPA: adenylate/guanylate cyclase domain-containing protein [Acidimicrobiales bacterium]
MTKAAGGQVEVVVRSLMRRLPGANLIGALVVFVYLTWLPPPGGRRSISSYDTRDVIVSVVVFLAYLTVSFPVGYQVCRRMAMKAMEWLEEDRPPAQYEVSGTLSLAWRYAVCSFALWLGAAFVFYGLNLVFDPSGYQSMRVALGILLGGMSTSALAFLLAERAMRPVFALALVNGRPPRSRRLRLGPKLVLTWALGSGVPLLGIALSPLGLGPGGRADLIGPVVGLSVVGLFIGCVMTIVAARMLSDPLEQLRAGVARVENGDEDVEVLVDDAGTLGYLQLGFNRMVAGLRERRRLEDLFGRHVGVDVARRALDNGVNLDGERREVSVMFVDLIGSTGLAQREGADVVVETLNAFFDVVVTVVTAEGGWVNKFEGDGAVCVFGAPAEQPDHAARALRAAHTLRKELLALAVSHPTVDAGIGVSSGVAVAGNVGAAERYEYTVIGDPVNEAARLTEQAKARLGRVLASEETIARSAGEGLRWGEVGPLELRGRGAVTLAYEPGPTGGLPSESAPTEEAAR